MRDVGPLSTIPYLPRLLIGQIVYRKVTSTLHGQGTGRYSPAEIAALKLETWTALDALVGEGWVLGGEGPTDADACLFGFLAASMTALALVLPSVHGVDGILWVDSNFDTGIPRRRR